MNKESIWDERSRNPQKKFGVEMKTGKKNLFSLLHGVAMAVAPERRLERSAQGLYTDVGLSAGLGQAEERAIVSIFPAS